MTRLERLKARFAKKRAHLDKVREGCGSLDIRITWAENEYFLAAEAIAEFLVPRPKDDAA